jgi:uncharacterized protein with von Willebrand factor type A (vWA) domain
VSERAFTVETVELDLPPLAAALSRRLHTAGVPSTPERAADFARALTLVEPVARRQLYWTARALFVTDRSQVAAFDAVFAAVFGTPAQEGADAGLEPARSAPAPTDEHEPPSRDAPPNSDGAEDPNDGPASSAPRRNQQTETGPEVAVATLASEHELLRRKRFEVLEPRELAELYRLMRTLQLATPLRRTRRYEKGRRGGRLDMRRTLRSSLRTGGDPIALARRRRRIHRRRLVMLCDISGSMEPYARAYIQLLTCAAGSGPDAEVFVFATRLTRLTKALATRSPERAIQRAAEAAPDWSSGTRIGDALKAFNDRHGRRGMARGAVIVILSDGWERGDPLIVGREMARLRRLAHRVVWVNPRAAAPGFTVAAAGMVAALPHCDALVSGHSFDALGEVVDAIAEPNASRRRSPAAAALGPPGEADPWASATPIAGSSVAMPSGYGPARGKTTPGWSAGSAQR